MDQCTYCGHPVGETHGCETCGADFQSEAMVRTDGGNPENYDPEEETPTKGENQPVERDHQPRQSEQQKPSERGQQPRHGNQQQPSRRTPGAGQNPPNGNQQPPTGGKQQPPQTNQRQSSQGGKQQPPQSGHQVQPPQQGKQPRGQPPQQETHQQPPQGGRPPGGPGQSPGDGGSDDGNNIGRREFLAGTAGAAALAGSGYWYFLRGPTGASGAVAEYFDAIESQDQEALAELIHEESPIRYQVDDSQESEDADISVDIDTLEEVYATTEEDEIASEVDELADKIHEIATVISIVTVEFNSDEFSVYQTAMEEWKVVNDGEWLLWDREHLQNYEHE